MTIPKPMEIQLLPLELCKTPLTETPPPLCAVQVSLVVCISRLHAPPLEYTSSPLNAPLLSAYLTPVTRFRRPLPSPLRAPLDENQAAPPPKAAKKLKHPEPQIGNQINNRRFQHQSKTAA
ncbi:hypothetical protein Lal_00022374 [Lupinus albus]|nr:hypothetical protein Lal_00022374 [Lupinus albus]